MAEPDKLAVAVATAVAPWAGVARCGGVGDNLIAASVLRPLKAAGFRIEVISQDPHHVVFENNPFIDKLSIKHKQDFPQDGGMLAWQQWFASRAKEYAVFANLSHSMENLLAFFPASTAFYWPQNFRRKIANHNYLEVVHDIFDMPYEFGPLFFATAAEQQRASEVKKIVGDTAVGWCLSGSRIDKVYPSATFAVARIIKELNVPVMMFGAPGKDFGMAEKIQWHVKEQNGSLDGLHCCISPDPEKPTWPVRRLLSQVLACDVVIGPDTGPMWAVAFEPMPKIMTLSHASPENITKHWRNTVTLTADPRRVPCWPCHRLHDNPDTCVPNRENNGAACISDISVEHIVQAVAQCLIGVRDGQRQRLCPKGDAGLGAGRGNADTASDLVHGAVAGRA